MRLIATLVACVAMFGAASAFAGEPGKMNLSAMGLKGLKPMTAQEGMQVRGRGYVLTQGVSFVTIAGATGTQATAQQNNYALSTLGFGAYATSSSAATAGLAQQSFSSTTQTNYSFNIPVSAVNVTTIQNVATQGYASGFSTGFAY